MVQLMAKIGKEEHIIDMYSKEYIYFSQLKRFRGHDSSRGGRLDPRELNVSSKQLNYLTISTPSGKDIHLHKALKAFSAQLNNNLVDPDILCCSMHLMQLEPHIPYTKYDNRLEQLGSSALLIYDVKRFLSELDKALQDMKLEHSRKMVTYYSPKTYTGELSLHHKDEAFKYLNEYRILAYPSCEDYLKLNIQSLQKMSVLIPTTELDRIKAILE